MQISILFIVNICWLHESVCIIKELQFMLRNNKNIYRRSNHLQCILNIRKWKLVTVFVVGLFLVWSNTIWLKPSNNKYHLCQTPFHTSYLSRAPRAVPVEKKSAMWRNFSTEHIVTWRDSPHDRLTRWKSSPREKCEYNL